MRAEIAAIRRLRDGRDDALDRHGADLAVPRLSDRLSFAPAPTTGTAPPDDHRIIGIAERESDDDYRRRLGLYRGFGRTTPLDLERRLNGPGDDRRPERRPARGARGDRPLPGRRGGQPVRRRGPPGRPATGSRPRSSSTCAGAPGVAVQLRGRAGDPQGALPAQLDPHVGRCRAAPACAEAFDLKVDAPVAPLLASSLDRVGRVRKALTGDVGWPLLRAQDDAAGSRYELGLGVGPHARSAPPSSTRCAPSS